MKRLHKKILIVIRLKIVEILIVLGCAIMAALIIYGLSWLIVRLGIGELLEIVLAWAVVGIAILIFLSVIVMAITCWFEWNWDKAEKIMEQSGGRLK